MKGENPIDVIQAVLAKRLPPVSSVRLDVPETISAIIRRMTNKPIEERYHSISGLKNDLAECRKLLEDGESESLDKFVIGTKDVSSFFMLPSGHFGRESEYAALAKVIDRARERASTDSATHSLQDIENSSRAASDRRGSVDGLTRSSEASSISGNSPSLGPQGSENVQRSVRSKDLPLQYSLNTRDNRASVATGPSGSSQRSTNRTEQNGKSSRLINQTPHRRGKLSRKRRCELVLIKGAPGIGKSSLLSDLQLEIRNSGYTATAKFDSARKAPFEPLLQAMSSLFRQIFSESDLNSEYHQLVAEGIRPFWPSVCSMLGLPESLLGDTRTVRSGTDPANPQHSIKSLQTSSTDYSSTYSARSGGSSSNETRGSLSASRSMKFINIFVEILRILSTHKLICFCLDNLQYADDESLDLLLKILEMRLGIVLLVSVPSLPLIFPLTIQDNLRRGGALGFFESCAGQ